MTDKKMSISRVDSDKLRKPFPASSIGTLPKGGTQVRYVGHAAVTDRLLSVDPGWTWEPMAFTPQGLPALDSEGNLWIRLTVLGTTRPGCGDGRTMKERIGDAIRNAAMRYGVALQLWSKDELETVALLQSAPEGVVSVPGFSGLVEAATTDEELRVLWGKATSQRERDEIMQRKNELKDGLSDE